MKKYLFRVLIWLTQGFNVIVLAGNPDETTSSRAYRLRNRPAWGIFRKVIDGFLGEDHCEDAYYTEKRRVASWDR
tara:strand:- start:1814 stop:2038 length:225 start_codon:yes stop_codon:yes gene_type:complete